MLLNPQPQSLLTPPPMEWRSGHVHMNNPFNILPMKILLGNYRGADNCNFRRNFANLNRVHRLDITVIIETRISGHRAKAVSPSLGFDSVCHSDATGFQGGIWVLWNDNNISLDILSMIEQSINAFVLVSPVNPSSSWLFSTIYASPDFNKRLTLWEEL